jgi:hypothetical protein
MSERTLAEEMNQTRAIFQQQVAVVVDDPNVPEYVKVMIQNAMGALYYQGNIFALTLVSNQTNTLSPFANMNGTISIDKVKTPT